MVCYHRIIQVWRDYRRPLLQPLSQIDSALSSDQIAQGFDWALKTSSNGDSKAVPELCYPHGEKSSFILIVKKKDFSLYQVLCSLSSCLSSHQERNSQGICFRSHIVLHQWFCFYEEKKRWKSHNRMWKPVSCLWKGPGTRQVSIQIWPGHA